jgi:uncharacterized membrane protein
MKIPIKTSALVETASVIILIIAFALSFYFYTHFPDKVVTHWNFRGEPNGYMGPFGGAFVLPIIMFVIYLGFIFLPALDPKKERYADFSRPYNIFRISILAMLLVIYMVAGLFNLGYAVPINIIVPFLVGVLMIVIGNLLGKVKNNWFVGIRNPWTLSSENVWNKTHRVGGFLFVIFGFIIMVVPILSPTPGLILFFIGIITIVLGTSVYSYILYRKEQNELKNKSDLLS